MNPATEATRAFDLILQSEQALQEGRQARDRAIIAMRQQGMSHRRIAISLQEQAEARGLTEDQISDLGISLGAVNWVLRDWKSIERDRRGREGEE